ncbi:hypothetical protein [Glutamicibacter sp. BW77]|uniref:hypothetical protein n=1 Tax=Glutamicibacter sp. BW77 TaxID=2024402 RepID=UPI0011448A04|nr:hypothetical protein [Glutamicibacter sp. BW77]
MKKSIFGAASGIAIAILLLSACTSSSTSETAAPVTTPDNSSTSPSSTVLDSAGVYKRHSESIQRLSAGNQILSEVEGNGSVQLTIGEVPDGFDSVGFIVSCEGSSSWDIALSSETNIGGSDCGDDAAAETSLSILRKELDNQEVRLELREKVKVWATVFATNEQ